MSVFDPELRRCDRTRAHHRHEFVMTAGARVVYECPGRTGTADSLAVLLARRPDLADVTAVAITNRLAVSAA